MVFYEYLRDHVFGKNKDGSFDLWWVQPQNADTLFCVYTCYRKCAHRKCSFHRKSILCGMTSGGAAQMLASPTDLVKVRLQMDGRRELEGLEPRCV